MLWVHLRRGYSSPFLIREIVVKELSIFVDESGDFGEYNHISPFYLVTLILHEQSNSINEQVETLDLCLSNINIDAKAIHTAPLIRREDVYKVLAKDDRMKIFNTFFHFMRKVDIKYKNIIVEKKHKDSLDINNYISKKLSAFLKDNLCYFQQFDKIIIYYDNGQKQLANILVSVFSSWFHDKFDYRTVSPYEYRLFQVADFICTLSLIENKLSCGQCLTKSESLFFESPRNLKMKYLKQIKRLNFE